MGGAFSSGHGWRCPHGLVQITFTRKDIVVGLFYSVFIRVEDRALLGSNLSAIADSEAGGKYLMVLPFFRLQPALDRLR